MRIPASGLGAALGLAAIGFSPGADAAELRLTLRAAAGEPVVNAVVTAYPAKGGFAPTAAAAPLAMQQQNIAFSPYVLVAPVGSDVLFPNRDKVRHSVYSFSPTHPFQLRLYGREDARSVKFDKAGVVALGCNIHDRMAAYVKVVDTRFAAKSDATGQVVLAGLPAGPVVVKIWHPNQKAVGGEITQNLVTPDAGLSLAVTLDLRPAASGRQTQ